MEYAYKVRDSRGKLLKGVQKAKDRDSLIYNLLRQGYYIISLQEVNRSSLQINRDFLLFKVSSKEVLIITRQFLLMLSAGFPIVEAFKIMGEKSRKRILKQALQKIHDDIEEGETLWRALSRHPQIFSGIYTNMIRAGEMGGSLERVLESLAQHLEREQDIKAKVKAASIYPLIITLMALLLVFFIIAFIMPALLSVFVSVGAEIPRPTQWLLNLGLFLKQHRISIAVIGIAVILLIRMGGQTDRGKEFRDKLFLRLPLGGTLLSHMIMARFARIMAILLQAGIPILSALEMAASSLGNTAFTQAILQASQEISAGKPISEPLAATLVFDAMFIQMIAIGEESGSLDNMFARTADYYEQELLYSLGIVMAAIEPLLIIFVALLVTAVVIAAILPVFDLMSYMA